MNRTRSVTAAWLAALVITGGWLGWGPASRGEDLRLAAADPESVGMSGQQLADAQRLFEQAVERDDVRGVVLLVARRGKIVLHEALGWKNKEDQQPMQKDTLFKMASNTKPVVATAVLQLVEQGKLRLSDNVRRHIPAWDNYRAGYIKIEHLLSHTSGLRIPGVFIRPLLTKSEQHPSAPSLQAEVDRFGTIGAREVPGTTYSYNNPGFQVAGRLVEIAAGQPLGDYLREHIYQPLGMPDSWNYEPAAPAERMARVYRREGDRWQLKWKPEDGADWPFVRGSGGMISTAGDYAKFCQMYLNGGIYGGQRILAESSVRLATSPVTRSLYPVREQQARDNFYGLGWSVEQDGVFRHGGSDGTYAWVDPARQLIVLVFTQSPGGKNPRVAFRDQVVAACQDLPSGQGAASRPRLRELDISIGILPTGALNAITDVAGVHVGHRSLIQGDSVRTGVTAVLPHEGNLFQQKVPAALEVANGFGKFVGATQVDELGVIETPILLTNTLSTFTAADAAVAWTLEQPGNEDVRSVNPVVGECNDGLLNDIRAQTVTAGDVRRAIAAAESGPVPEGCVGAGVGTRCLGWKGGIGTSSRIVPEPLGGYVVGVLVQTNFGGSLTVAGAPVGRRLGRFFLQQHAVEQEHGSCIVIVATNAPLDARQLGRLAKRATLGIAAVGSPITHGSGDYILAFSTDPGVRQSYVSSGPTKQASLLRDDGLSVLFQAVREATEEAILNSMLKSVTTTGFRGRQVEAIDPQDLLGAMDR